MIPSGTFLVAISYCLCILQLCNCKVIVWLQNNWLDLIGTLWVRKLLQCYLYFCLWDFVPCYFIPGFLQPLEGYLRSRHIDLCMVHTFRERRHIADAMTNEDSLMRAFRMYWSVCDAETEVDFQLPVPQPLFEHFNRKELIENLSRLTND